MPLKEFYRAKFSTYPSAHNFGPAIMSWYRGPSGSAQDLIELQKEVNEEETPAVEISKLRRVLTSHTKRRKKKAHRVGGFCLTSVLKEPLCLVNSVPLNFELGR